MASQFEPTVGERASPGGPAVDRRGPQQQRRIEMLADIAERLLAGEDLDTQVMPALTRALSDERILDASLGYIITDLEEGMKLGFMEGFDSGMIQRCLRLDFGQAICGTVAATGQAMHVTDIQRSFDPISELVRGAGINAYACEPLIIGGRLLGTLSFASRNRRRFDPEDLHFFKAIARLVARARERNRSGKGRKPAGKDRVLETSD
jgi:GAF domain-containing protein